MTAENVAFLRQGEGIYAELCVTCHGPDGKGAPVALAPAGTMKAPFSLAVAACPGASGLRDQSGDARVDGTNRREHLHGRHGADGFEQRRLDRGHHLVRPQQLRQHRIDRQPGRCREGASAGRQSTHDRGRLTK